MEISSSLRITNMFKNLYQRIELIKILTLRDFKIRFRGSFGGILWSVAQPLFMMIIYTLVFSKFLGVQFGDSDSPYTYAVFLLCGLLCWNVFSESLSVSTTVVRNNNNLVKRVVFPLEILPVNTVLVSLIQQIIGLALLIPLATLVNQRFYWTMFFLPVIILIQVLLCFGLNYFWTGFSVFFPDLKHITTLLLSGLIFLTPIFYPIDSVSPRIRTIIYLNPIAHLVDWYRKVIMEGTLPDIWDILIIASVSIALFMIGYLWFMRNKHSFIDVL